MPKIIELPDGTEAEFPDEMPDAEIESVLRRQFAPQASGGTEAEQKLDRALQTGGLPGLVTEGVKGAVTGAAKMATAVPRLAMDTPRIGEMLAKGGVTRLPQALAEDVSTRYGTPRRALATAVTDPVGLLGDVSTVLAPVRGLAKATGSKALGAVAKLDPLAAAARGGEKVADRMAAGSGRMAERIYDHALKPLVSIEQKNQNVPPAARVLVEANVSLGKRGQQKIGRINRAAAESTKRQIEDSRAIVDTEALFSSPQVQAAGDKAARSPVPGASRRFEKTIEHNKNLYSRQDPATGERAYAAMPVQNLQNAKVDLNAALRPKFGKAPMKPGQDTALDALRSSEMQAIEEAVPGVRESNRRFAETKVAKQQLDRALRRDANADLVKLRAYLAAGGIGAGVGGYSNGPEGLGQGLLAGLLFQYGLSPGMVSRYALATNNLGKAAAGAVRAGSRATGAVGGPASVLSRMADIDRRTQR